MRKLQKDWCLYLGCNERIFVTYFFIYSPMEYLKCNYATETVLERDNTLISIWLTSYLGDLVTWALHQSLMAKVLKNDSLPFFFKVCSSEVLCDNVWELDVCVWQRDNCHVYKVGHFHLINPWLRDKWIKDYTCILLNFYSIKNNRNENYIHSHVLRKKVCAALQSLLLSSYTLHKSNIGEWLACT